MSSTESIELTNRTRNDLENNSTRSFDSVVISLRGAASEEVPEQEEEYYPDGGIEAYLVIAGSFLGLVVNLGIINSIGAIQAYVSTHQLALVSASSISWIFSIYLSLAYITGIFVGPMFDRHGPLQLLLAATAFIFIGLMSLASSIEVYQFIMSFVALGLGNGLGMTPLIGIISHWFLKRRGNFTGVATSGGSVGGLAFPLMLRHSYAAFGFTWAIRIFAFTCLACMLLSIILVKGRFKSTSSSDQHFNSKWDKFKHKLTLKNLKLNDAKYNFVVAGSFFTELSLVLLLTYFPTYAIAQGVSESTALLLLTVWNGFGILGRWVPSYASDHIGHFNINIVMLIIYSICIYVMWLPFGYNTKVLFAFASFGGFCQGSISSLLPACLSQITPVNEIGYKFGVLNSFLSIANLFGIPLASTVIGNGSVHHYNNFVILVGLISIAGTIFWYCSRYAMVGFKLNAKV
ncbi:monocarboxylate permease [Scheffersomyces coipomensis]|uniref:monocarboxylate permease n=1 Tax=Scheffersomyces coipomensis TaxID=1788519 RepID=UPI00315C6B16